MKKTLKILIILLVSILFFFVVTNPSVDRFKDFCPSSAELYEKNFDKDCQKELEGSIIVDIGYKRTKNFILFSYYEMNYLLRSDNYTEYCNNKTHHSYYWGAAYNFFPCNISKNGNVVKADFQSIFVLVLSIIVVLILCVVLDYIYKTEKEKDALASIEIPPSTATKTPITEKFKERYKNTTKMENKNQEDNSNSQEKQAEKSSKPFKASTAERERIQKLFEAAGIPSKDETMEHLGETTILFVNSQKKEEEKKEETKMDDSAEASLRYLNIRKGK